MHNFQLRVRIKINTAPPVNEPFCRILHLTTTSNDCCNVGDRYLTMTMLGGGTTVNYAVTTAGGGNEALHVATPLGTGNFVDVRVEVIA